jgi:hypothetical protein
MGAATAARLAWCFAGVAVFIGGATARVVSEGRAELAASEAAWRAGDLAAATEHARTSARAYAPLAGHVARAYRRLHAIAENSEDKGDLEGALFAWRSIRAAAIGSRSVFTSHDRERQEADAAIARLSTRPTSGSRSSPAILASQVPPRAGWAALLLSGVVLWIGAGFRMVSGAWEADGRFHASELTVPLAVATVGLAAWCIGLLMA